MVKIEDYVFYNTGITSITIPDSVTSLGISAFSNCASLESATLGNGLTKVDKWLFRNCSSLKDVTLGENIQKVDNFAFAECGNLETITLPDSVTNIGISAFEKCRSLDDVKLPDGLTTVDKNAFLDCDKLTNVTIPDSVTTIGNQAFGYQTNNDMSTSKKDNFQITGKTGSAAADYANNSGISFNDPDAPTTTTTTDTTDVSGETTETTTVTTDSGTSSENICGDTTMDGKVDLVDAVLLNKFLAGAVTFTDQQVTNANCDQTDGTDTVGEEDTTALIRFVLNMEGYQTLPHISENA